MRFKAFAGILAGLLLCASGSALAQFGAGEADWTESEAPPPPAFDVGRLVTLEVVPGSSLVYGVDPASISISKSDSLVRYVMVARSASGASNVMYEGLRCSTAESKTYGRYADGRWTMVDRPEWRALGSLPSKHALRFARAGACDGAAPPTSVQDLVSRLKNPPR